MPATAKKPATMPALADVTSAPFSDADAPHEAQDAGNEAQREAVANEPAPFTPDTADKVDWVLGKIADARSRAARVRENADAIAKAHEAEADGLLWKFGPALADFARRETEGTKRRSVRLLNGQIGFRTKPAAFTVSDDAAALAWVKENLPAVLRLDKRALADVLAVTEEGNTVHGETGERLPFMQAQPAEDVFFVK